MRLAPLVNALTCGGADNLVTDDPPADERTRLLVAFRNAAIQQCVQGHLELFETDV
jgi:hypothetical protein